MTAPATRLARRFLCVLPATWLMFSAAAGAEGKTPTPAGTPPQAFKLPTWPQEFQVSGADPTSLGFPITQVGPVVVDLKWNGPELDALLRGPAAAVARQRGTGQLRLTYQVTQQDVQRGVLWMVTLRLADPQAGHASGRINVQSPPVDPSAARARTETLVAQLKTRSDRLVTEMQAQSGVGRTTEQGVSSRAVGMATGNEAAAQKQRTLDPGIGRLQPLPPPPPPAEQPAPTRPIGPAPVQTTCQPPANPGQRAGGPTLQSANVSNDVTGKPRIILSGTALPSGTVHFLVAGQEKVQPARSYSSTSIEVSLPSGIDFTVPTDGYIYVGSAASSTNSICFRFVPVMEQQSFTFYWLCPTEFDRPHPVCNIGHPWGSGAAHSVKHETLGFWGFKGDDEFRPAIGLKPSFKVVDIGANLTWAGGMNGGAVIAEKRLGVDPYLKVHWWLDPFGSTHYYVNVVLEGPAGVFPYVHDVHAR